MALFVRNSNINKKIIHHVLKWPVVLPVIYCLLMVILTIYQLTSNHTVPRNHEGPFTNVPTVPEAIMAIASYPVLLCLFPIAMLFSESAVDNFMYKAGITIPIMLFILAMLIYYLIGLLIEHVIRYLVNMIDCY